MMMAFSLPDNRKVALSTRRIIAVEEHKDDSNLSVIIYSIPFGNGHSGDDKMSVVVAHTVDEIVRDFPTMF